MKKILSFGFVLVLAAVFCFSAVAAPNGFVSSPTSQSAPELVSAENSDPDCDGVVIITPYSEKDELDDDSKQTMEDAYDSIVNTENLEDLNDDLKDAAEKQDVKPGNLAVSDLFDIDFECDEHDGHGHFDVTLKPGSLDNFVALMYYDGENWVMVDDANVSGNHLSFTLMNPATMAIFVDSGAGNISSPQTGDDFPWVYVAVIAVCLAGLGVVLFKLKKKEA